MSGSKLPVGWVLASLPNFTRIEMGQSPPSTTYNTKGNGLPFFQGKAEFGSLYPEVRKHCSEPNRIAEPGATLLSVRAPVGPTNLARERCCIGRGLAAIHPLDDIPEKFVLWLLRSREPEISEQGTGSTFAAINRKFLHDFTIPLPPLAEQKRIVAKIEELFSELDAGEESLRRARRQLGVYRQSLLKQAFEGKLTAPWRLSAHMRAQAGAQIGDVVPEARDGQWFAYIIECDGDSYYVGSTNNLRERWRRHCEGTGADWTKVHPPRYLIHYETFLSEDQARKRESDWKTGFGRTWRKREINAGRLKPLVHNAKNPNTEPVQGDPLPPGDQLLARIQAERQAHYQQQLKEWEKAVKTWEKGGKKCKRPSKPREPKKLRDLDDEVRSDLAELPAEWFWSSLGLMTLGVEYGTAAKSQKDGKCPVIRMGNLQGGEIDWNDLVFTSDAEEIAQYELQAGDVLFNRTNSPELVGKTAIYRGTRPAVFAGYLIRVNQIPSVVDSRYLNHFLSSRTAKQYGNTVKTDGVNQSNINGEKLCGYPFPYCSLPEQQEIVRLLDEQFEVIDQNKREIDAALKRSEALRQSILKKAFTGQLVPQDPTDEPATELLSRIRSGRETKVVKPARKQPRKKAHS